MNRPRPWDNKTTPFKNRHVHKGYKTNRWTKSSLNFRLQNPVCQWPGCNHICLDGKGVTDHIISVAKGGAFWDRANWQSLCVGHHAMKTGMENRTGILYKTKSNESGELIPLRDPITNKLISIDDSKSI